MLREKVKGEGPLQGGGSWNLPPPSSLLRVSGLSVLFTRTRESGATETASFMDAANASCSWRTNTRSDARMHQPFNTLALLTNIIQRTVARHGTGHGHTPWTHTHTHKPSVPAPIRAQSRSRVYRGSKRGRGWGGRLGEHTGRVLLRRTRMTRSW